jgi:hypothetical protein
MRLTLVQGQPFPSSDVALTSTLFDCDLGSPGLSLNLAGLPALSLQDVFSDGTELMTLPMPMMELPVTGITPIGGMTGEAGLAAAFDGNLSKNSASSAMSSALVAGYALPNSIGFQISSTLLVTRIRITSPTDTGFDGSGIGRPWKLIAFPSNTWGSGIQIAGGYGPPSDFTRAVQIEARIANGLVGNFDYWFCWYANGINNVHVCQVEAWCQLPISARGIVTLTGMVPFPGSAVNAAAVTMAGNSGPVLVPAFGAKYRGTILISETAGMMRQTLGYGLNRMFPIWNMIDRRRIKMVAGCDADPTMGGFPPTPGHYQFSPTQQPTANDGYAFSPAMGNPNISVTVVNGMADSTADVSYYQAVTENSAGAASTPPIPAAATALWAAVNEKNPTDVVLPTDLLSPFGSWAVRNLDTDITDEGINVKSEYVSAPFYGAKTWRAVLGARSALCICTYREQNQRLTVDFEC